MRALVMQVFDSLAGHVRAARKLIGLSGGIEQSVGGRIENAGEVVEERFHGFTRSTLMQRIPITGVPPMKASLRT